MKNLEKIYDLPECKNWIRQNGYKKVCLQFPDDMLPDSSDISLWLQKSLDDVKVYILGDTAYGSCCVDFTAASHVAADAIIHFGDSCFSSSKEKTPVFYVYDKTDFDIDRLKKSVTSLHNPEIDLIIDTCYFHLQSSLQDRFGDEVNVIKINETRSIRSDSAVIFLGQEKKLINVKLSLRDNDERDLWYFKEDLERFDQDGAILKRRMFLSEKIKSSATIGIIVATLSVKSYLETIDRMKTLLKRNDKKYYIVSVGKPTVAKLANFPEIEIYVTIACPLYELYESRDFYKPIATPFDLEMALNPDNTDLADFSYDFRPTGELPERPEKEEASGEDDRTVALKSSGVLVLDSSSGVSYLYERTWKGLEENLGQSEVKLAEEGRRGIARGYSDEPSD